MTQRPKHALATPGRRLQRVKSADLHIVINGFGGVLNEYCLESFKVWPICGFPFLHFARKKNLPQSRATRSQIPGTAISTQQIFVVSNVHLRMNQATGF